MKKIVIGMISASALIMMGTFVHAADVTNTAGEAVVISSANVNGAPATMVFNPSPQVLMQVNHGALQFNATAGHTGSYNNTGGKEYAVAYDSTKVFFKDVSGIATPTLDTIASSNSSDFSGEADWFY